MRSHRKRCCAPASSTTFILCFRVISSSSSKRNGNARARADTIRTVISESAFKDETERLRLLKLVDMSEKAQALQADDLIVISSTSDKYSSAMVGTCIS